MIATRKKKKNARIESTSRGVLVFVDCTAFEFRLFRNYYTRYGGRSIIFLYKLYFYVY